MGDLNIPAHGVLREPGHINQHNFGGEGGNEVTRGFDHWSNHKYSSQEGDDCGVLQTWHHARGRDVTLHKPPSMKKNVALCIYLCV